MKTFLLTLFTAVLAAASALSAHAAPPALDAGELRCAAEDMQLFYYYLEPKTDPKLKEYKTACRGSQAAVKMPDWLAAGLPAMNERKAWKGPEAGEISEAQLWQLPISNLYALTSKLERTLPETSTGAVVSPYDIERELDDIRGILAYNVDRLIRAKMDDSFEGRGKGLISTLNMAIEQVDILTGALAVHDLAAYNVSAGKTINLSRELFAQLFSPPLAVGAAGYYVVKPIIMPGYRAVSLPVPGYQAFFLKPGDRVDLLVTFEALMADDYKEIVTATILQDNVVLNVSRPETLDGVGVVQLMCNPNEAQYAALSLAEGKRLSFIRRAPDDTELHPMEMASFKKLLK